MEFEVEERIVAIETLIPWSPLLFLRDHVAGKSASPVTRRVC